MEASGEAADNGGEALAEDVTPALHKYLMDITKEIRELKNDITALNTSFKQDFASFKEDVYNKLKANKDELQDQKKSFNEAQTHIEELEAFNLEAKDTLLTTLHEQRKLQDKLTDLEGRSRRNNVRIFGVPEGAEGDSVPRFVEELLQRKLTLPEGTSLLIQRAHRATARRPGPGETPRSIIINLLRFDTKEMILRKAWQKRVKLGNSPLYFDNDYAAEVVQQRRAYMEIKKTLKAKGIRFQTPLTRIRIHWTDGPRLYNSAQEAAKEMRKRGMDVQMKEADEERTMEERIHAAWTWQHVGEPGACGGLTQRTRGRLQEFRRAEDRGNI
ncbi:hypothetical protein D5F01_LYC08898 [Larimichthys crocea]|uniref:L1 transposable element RRM domain-containing protein n=1 Tax=Larimichthys crocea TaxID=215358 RepID=A0A6G0IJS1_LARCR|nr:hypothetical protein D5F01_LYC08897 [Larimichthys crocea]KAE8291544.1 hypothetical protein D5F01_LYC08898 [Larimichthys crocea]